MVAHFYQTISFQVEARGVVVYDAQVLRIYPTLGELLLDQVSVGVLLHHGQHLVQEKETINVVLLVEQV